MPTTMSQWSELANVLYIPALLGTYGWWTVRFFQHWRSVMKWPDILLLCFGLAIMGAAAIPKVILYLEQPVAVVSSQINHVVPAPIDSAELDALRQSNAKLKAENARLRKVHVIGAAPSACASATPVLILSKLSAEDCDDLTTDQKLVDNADIARIDASGLSDTEQNRQKFLATEVTEQQAMTNLFHLETRLCGERKR